MDAQDVFKLWCTESTPKEWFIHSAEFDARIRGAFQETYWIVVRGETEETWRYSPEGKCAEIIMLDQFPRNMFRGMPQA